jgi:hypothetical protein
MTTSPPPSNSVPPPPSGDYPSPEAPSRPPRPKGLEISFWLWITYLAIGASNAVIGFIQRDRNRADAINAVIAQYPGMDRAMVESVATGVVLGMVVLGLLFVVAGLSLALLMRGGRNWARIVLPVLGCLSILVMIGPVGTDLQALFQFLLLVGAIVMMFQRPVNQWFRPRRPGI